MHAHLSTQFISFKLPSSTPTGWLISLAINPSTVGLANSERENMTSVAILLCHPCSCLTSDRWKHSFPWEHTYSRAQHCWLKPAGWESCGAIVILQTQRPVSLRSYSLPCCDFSHCSEPFSTWKSCSRSRSKTVLQLVEAADLASVSTLTLWKSPFSVSLLFISLQDVHRWIWCPEFHLIANSSWSISLESQFGHLPIGRMSETPLFPQRMSILPHALFLNTLIVRPIRSTWECGISPRLFALCLILILCLVGSTTFHLHKFSPLLSFYLLSLTSRSSLKYPTFANLIRWMSVWFWINLHFMTWVFHLEQQWHWTAVLFL